jgi:hypothetical protein
LELWQESTSFGKIKIVGLSGINHQAFWQGFSIFNKKQFNGVL